MCGGLHSRAVGGREGLFFVLGQQVQVVLESCAGDLDVVGAAVEVGEDGGVVAFMLLGIDAVVEDAAVFLYGQLVSIPIGAGTVALVLGGI